MSKAIAGERFYIGRQADPADRKQIVVSYVDAEKIRAVFLSHYDFAAQTTVTDRLTGERVTVRRADCGLGCRCALELVS